MTTDLNKWKTKGISFKKVVDPITKNTVFEDGSIPESAIASELLAEIHGQQYQIGVLNGQLNLLTQKVNNLEKEKFRKQVMNPAHVASSIIDAIKAKDEVK